MLRLTMTDALVVINVVLSVFQARKFSNQESTERLGLSLPVTVVYVAPALITVPSMPLKLSERIKTTRSIYEINTITQVKTRNAFGTFSLEKKFGDAHVIPELF